MTQCNACGGTYHTTNADGTLYFHSCPPLSAPELAAKVAAGKVTLPAGETVEDAIARRRYERANKRDENVSGATDAKGKALPKAAGDGVRTVPDPPPNTGPVVIVGK